MGRKKVIEYIEESFTLAGGASITLKVPKDAFDAGAVRFQRTHNTFSIETGEGARVPLSAPNERSVRSGSDPVPQSNGPQHDTPEIIEAKKRLPAPKKVYTTQDALEEAGWGDIGLSPESLAGSLMGETPVA